MIRKLYVLLGLVICSMLCQVALAFDFPLPKDKAFTALTVEDDARAMSYDFNGIVALSNCSGSLIRYETSQHDDMAMVLTNGHCVDLIEPGVAYSKRKSRRRFTLLSSEAKSIGQVYSTSLEYATMTGTDIAVYRLEKSYREIEDQYGVEAFTLARDGAVVDDEIQILSGYWRRGYECSINHLVHKLLEDKWTFVDSLRYSSTGCNTIGGTSGSPVIMSGTKSVIAINNTGNESGKACTMNNPCEVDVDGNVFYKKGYSYGQQTSLIYDCLDQNLRIDLDIDSCRLTK